MCTSPVAFFKNVESCQQTKELKKVHREGCPRQQDKSNNSSVYGIGRTSPWTNFGTSKFIIYSFNNDDFKLLYKNSYLCM